MGHNSVGVQERKSSTSMERFSGRTRKPFLGLSGGPEIRANAWVYG